VTELYRTTVTATGGREGAIRSEDGILDLQLARPRTMGGAGNGTNPEQLFAGGYAACFGSAIAYASRTEGHAISGGDIDVTAEVGLGSDDSGGFRLSVALGVTLAGVDRATAEKIVEAAHAVCPYSNAVRGNIDVAISVTTR
jgi:lipoyl-dependent peroxiredoxin